MRYALLLLFLASLRLRAADWPQFNGPNGDCTSPETGINKDWTRNKPKELWRIILCDRGYGGPSAASNKLFIVDNKDGEDILRAVDVNIGKDAWRLRYPNPGPEQEYGFTRSTPAYSDGKVYALSRHGLLICADVEKGEKLWERDLVADFQGRKPTYFYAHSPVVDGEHLIVCPCGPGANVVCLDKKTGNEIWRGGGEEPGGYCTPIVAKIGGKKQYVLFTGVSVIGLDPSNGTQVWSYPWRTRFNLNIASPVVSSDTVFVSSDYDKGCALLNLAGGKPALVWENKLMQTHFNTPILFEGSYIGNSGNATKPGDLVGLDAKTGNAVFDKAGYETGGVLSVDGCLIVLNGRTGDVSLVKVDKTGSLPELGHIRPLGGQSWTAPILADGRLFVRNRDTLVCISVK